MARNAYFKQHPYFAQAALATILCLAVGKLIGLGIFEDAYITFRCADNFAEGHGLTFNPGEPVESTTCFFFALLLGLARKFLHFNPAFTAGVLNFGAVFFILWSLARRGAQRTPDTPPPALPNAGFWFGALNPGLWAYAHSGMEMIFFTGLLFAGFLFLLDHVELGRPAWPAGLAFGFAAITRMEAAAFAILAAGIALYFGARDRRWRGVAGVLAPFVIVFGPVLAYRWRYYGHPLPISYYVKVDGGSFALLSRGLSYVAHWLFTNPLVALTFFLAERYLRRKTVIARRSALGLLWMGAYAAYAAYVGGDYLPYHRFLVPLIPVAAWMIDDQWPLWAARVAASRPNLPPLTRGKLLGVFVGCQVFAWIIPLQFLGLFGEIRKTAGWREVGEALHRQIPDRHASIYTLAAGAVPYFSKLRAYDGLGLTDPQVAFKKVALGTGVPGHEKSDTSRILTLAPDIIIYLSFPKDAEIKNLPYYTKTEPKAYVDAFGKVYPLYLTPDQSGPTSLIGAHQAMTKFFDDDNFQSRYQLMKLRDPALTAVFFVRKDAPACVRRAFEPFRLHGRPMDWREEP